MADSVVMDATIVKAGFVSCFLVAKVKLTVKFEG